MAIGLVGKPNVGKSTFFAAATLAEAEMANYPFTTIEANRGVASVRVPDPGPDFGVVSTPRSGKVVGATRFVPLELWDVAGLVPGAHEGRGLGNQFLNDLARADALLHIVDASGSTDAEGTPVSAGSHDPLEDVAFLVEEIDCWVDGLLADGWDRMVRRVQQEHRKFEVALVEKLAGVGVTEQHARSALADIGGLGKPPVELEPHRMALAKALRQRRFPITLAWNKADAVAPEVLEKLLAHGGTAVSAQAELALAKGNESGLLAYVGGSATFEVKGTISAAQQKGLDYVRRALERLGSTGVHAALEAAMTHLKRIPVFPVEDDKKLTDKDGRVLPDCHLVPEGTTAKQLAYRVHTDLGEGFVRGIDCRTKRAVGADHVLQPGDVIRIAAKA